MNFESPDSSLIACESFSEIEIEEVITPEPETLGASADLKSNASDMILINEYDIPSYSPKKILL